MGRLHDSHIIQQWKNDFGGNLQHKGHMLGKRRERKQVPLGKKAVTANENVLYTVYHISKEFAASRNSESPGKEVNDRLFSHHVGQLQRWKKHFFKILNRLKFGEAAPLVDGIVIYCNLAPLSSICSSGVGPSS